MRVLSGVQPSGALHIGNYFGAIAQWVEMQEEGKDCYFFLADWHALTSLRDGDALRQRSLELTAGFIALGVDPDRSVIYRQSDLPEVLELMWILANSTSTGLLQRCVSFKDKVSAGITPNAGLFTYPVLQAADILIVSADVVPVGKDQQQHLEVTRDIVSAFHANYGVEVLTTPRPLIREKVATVPGTDGRKMSKSYGNTIDLFGREKAVRKSIMGIPTDSTSIEEPKPIDGSALHQLLMLFARDDEDRAWIEMAFTEGGTGYGAIKGRLFEQYLERFSTARARYDQLMADTGQIEDILAGGVSRAREVVTPLMQKLRKLTGVSGGLSR